MKYEGAKLLLGQIILMIIATIIISLSFTSCGSSKKAISKQSSSTDSVKVVKSERLRSVRKLSKKKETTCEDLEKDEANSFYLEGEIEFDSTDTEVTTNSAGDYQIKGKVKSYKFKSGGNATAKTVQKITKQLDELISTDIKTIEVKSDSLSLRKTETIITKNKARKSLLLSLWWLWVLIAIAGLVYWKRKAIKKKINRVIYHR